MANLIKWAIILYFYCLGNLKAIINVKQTMDMSAAWMYFTIMWWTDMSSRGKTGRSPERYDNTFVSCFLNTRLGFERLIHVQFNTKDHIYSLLISSSQFWYIHTYTSVFVEKWVIMLYTYYWVSRLYNNSVDVALSKMIIWNGVWQISSRYYILFSKM